VVGYSVADPSRYGLLCTSGDALTAFCEKPAAIEGAGPHFINAGIYVLEPAAYESIPRGRKVSIERETFPALIEKHGALTHYPLNGLWMDIGTFESYFQANFTLLARRYSQGEDWLWGERSDAALFKDLIYINKTAQLGKNVDLYHRVILMAGATISEGCRLRNCLVLPSARVGVECQLTDCVIGPGFAVADGSRLNNLLLVAGEPNTPFYPHAIEV
jgi:mannose-1-phosphate guanylyltransferase